MKSRRIIFICTKSITFNVFLRSMAEYLSSDYEILVMTTKVNKIYSRNINKIEIFFPSNLMEFFNFRNLYKTYLKINDVIGKYSNDIVFCHTPVASHLVRFFTFFKIPKIIYFVHGFRFNDAKTKILN